MGKRIFSRITSALSTTAIAVTALNIQPASASSSQLVKMHDHLCEEYNHEHDLDCELHGGSGVRIALLDAGVTEYETAENVSFINDDTIDSNHGNDMMSVLTDRAPDASVLDVRVLDDEGKGTYSTVEQGIRWAVDHDADIIVMSFVGENKSSLIESALAYAEDNNVLVVASAGNYSSQTAVYPAAYSTVISVGAVDDCGEVQNYSNFGDYVDTYVQWEDGTSGAAQYIAAEAAVAIEHDQNITVSDLRNSFKNNEKAELETSNEENADTIVYAAATCKSHSFRWVTTRYATCTSTGIRSYKCSKCGYVKQTQYISKTSHTFNGSYNITRYATCTTTGTKVGKCTKCGTVVSTVSIPAYGHNYGNWITAKNATCTVNGSKYRTCSRCKNKQTQIIVKTGHTFNGSYNLTKNATCTTTGTKVGKCTKCGTVVSTVSIPAYGHNYGNWITAKNATCTVNGSKYRTCSRCKNKQTQVIGKTGHTFNGSYNVTKNATCTTAGTKVGKCTKCGTVVSTVSIPAYGHNYGNWITTKKATCTVNGSKYRTCSRCKNKQPQVIGKTGHTFNGSYTVTKKATCTEAGLKVGKCTKCGTVVSKVTIPKLSGIGHTFNGSYNITKKATCTEAGLKVGKCTKCGTVVSKITIPKLSSVGHKFNGSYNIVKNATCTQAGLKEGYCERCGVVVSKITIPATKHIEGDVKVTKNATCTAEGKKEIKCKKCNTIFKTEKIAKKEHSYTLEKKTGVVKCSVCSTKLTGSDVTWEKYVNSSGASWNKLSKTQKENMAKSYLTATGNDSSYVNMVFEMGKDKHIININNVDKLKNCMEDLDKMSKISGFEYADELSNYLGYASVAADAYVFISNSNSNSSYANLENTLTSFVTLSSDLASYIPIAGTSYSKVIGGLNKPLKDMVKKCKKYNANEALVAIGAQFDIDSYKDLSDPELYKKCVDYYDEIEGHDRQYAEDMIQSVIYFGLDQDVKNATGMSLEEISKMINN